MKKFIILTIIVSLLTQIVPRNAILLANQLVETSHCKSLPDSRIFLPTILSPEAPWTGHDETEPNDSYIDANGPLASGHYYYGYPNEPDDHKDYFYFDTDVPGTIKIDLYSHVGQYVQLQLFYEYPENPFNDNIPYYPDSPDDPIDTGYFIEFNGAPKGRYYVYIYTGAGFSDTDAYTLYVEYPSTSTTSSSTFTTIFSSNYSNLIFPYDKTLQRPSGWNEIDGSASGGGISENSGMSWQPDTAIDHLQNPVVVWSNTNNGIYQIYARRWINDRWETLHSSIGSGISNTVGDSYAPSLAYYDKFTPYVVWHDDGGNDDRVPSDPEILIKYLNEETNVWEEKGEGSGTHPGLSDNPLNPSINPSLAISSVSDIYIAWQHIVSDTVGSDQIYIKKWNGVDDWIEAGNGSASSGGVSNSIGDSFHPDLIFDPYGTPYVTWVDTSYGNEEIYVKQGSGTSWLELEGSATDCGISDTTRPSTHPAIAIDSNGTPYVVWSESTGEDNTEIYVKKWLGEWVEVGDSSASGGGISNNDGRSEKPAISITPNDQPCIVWQDNSSTDNYDIYIRCWDGSEWSEVDNGSATAGGISSTFGHSYDPSISISQSDGTIYVAWDEDRNKNSGAREIYVLKHAAWLP